ITSFQAAIYYYKEYNNQQQQSKQQQQQLAAPSAASQFHIAEASVRDDTHAIVDLEGAPSHTLPFMNVEPNSKREHQQLGTTAAAIKRHSTANNRDTNKNHNDHNSNIMKKQRDKESRARLQRDHSSSTTINNTNISINNHRHNLINTKSNEKQQHNIKTSATRVILDKNEFLIYNRCVQSYVSISLSAKNRPRVRTIAKDNEYDNSDGSHLSSLTSSSRRKLGHNKRRRVLETTQTTNSNINGRPVARAVRSPSPTILTNEHVHDYQDNIHEDNDDNDDSVYEENHGNLTRTSLRHSTQSPDTIDDHYYHRWSSVSVSGGLPQSRHPRSVPESADSLGSTATALSTTRQHQKRFINLTSATTTSEKNNMSNPIWQHILPAVMIQETELYANQSKVGVRLKGKQTGLYMCFNKRGKLHTRLNGTSVNCLFHQEPTDHTYVRFRSVYNETWLIGFDENT
ncbi:Fibroblast growth factor 18, partial [Fragariocoptes setiger]